jgi:hypothetical protein
MKKSDGAGGGGIAKKVKSPLSLVKERTIPFKFIDLTIYVYV